MANKIKSRGYDKVVDGSGALLFYLRKNNLYDLRLNKVASCKRVEKWQIYNYSTTDYVTDGKCLYLGGLKCGTILRGHRNKLIVALAIVLLLAVALLALLTYENWKQVQPDIFVVDKNGEWGGGNIDIFGSGKLKPGDKGRYSFMVTNPSTVNITCTIKFKFNGESNVFLPSVGYTIVSEGQTLKQELADDGFAVKNVVIQQNESRAFYVEWEWLFEAGKDDFDTAVGISGSKYSATIEIIAEQTR